MEIKVLYLKNVHVLSNTLDFKLSNTLTTATYCKGISKQTSPDFLFYFIFFKADFWAQFPGN